VPCNEGLEIEIILFNFRHVILHPIVMNNFSAFQFLDFEIGQNSIREYLWVVFFIALSLLLRRFLSNILSKLIFKLIRRKERSTAVQSFVLLLSKPLGLITTLLIVYLCLTSLNIPDAWHLSPSNKPGILMIFNKIYLIGIICAFTFLGLRFIDFFALEILNKEDPNDLLTNKQLIPFLKELIKIFLVIIAFFFSLGFIFELNVANLVAGLGLGGLAFALAAKESLENLFASFTIFLDKPFVVGDLITVNNITGNIEKVGFRSTRIRTFEKSVVFVPNKLLIDNPLDNLMLRTHRRADSNLILEYQTPKQNLEGFLVSVRNYLESHPRCNEESMARLVEHGDNGFNIRILYFVNTKEFNEFCAIREEINLNILDIASATGCSFAFPTRTVLIKKLDEIS
jgi:MscS family membrane protein